MEPSEKTELSQWGGTKAQIYVFDIETYPNCFLAIFKTPTETKKRAWRVFTGEELDKLRHFLKEAHRVLVGYNNFAFDDVILKAVLAGLVHTPEEIHTLAQRLINGETKDDKKLRDLTYKSRKEWNDRSAPWICVDLFQILGGRRGAGSLKSHEVRLGMLNVQDLPFQPGTALDAQQIEELTAYCQHDVNATEVLFADVHQDIDVRQEVNNKFSYLNQSALRRSNASIAEEVITREIGRRAGLLKRNIRKPSKYHFDPAAMLDPAIAFVCEHNQALLKRLQSLPPFEPTEWLKGFNQGFVFKVGSHTISLGKGGAHTLIGHKKVGSENIVEYDVTSYYPSLLRKFNRYPAGLTKEWIEILNELTDSRLAAKQSGHQAKAGVYKIIINSIYGKLEDPHSMSRDAALQLTVVLNGQLMLIMLMEAFDQAGFEVISGNTDGVYIDARNQPEQAHVIAQRWMEQTGLELEKNTSSIYVASSVNDYALHHPDRGWYHRKGRFGVAKRTKPSIITDAVLNHYGEGDRIEAYIRSGSNILDFLYSSTIRSKKAVQIRHGEACVQRTNRWYKSVNGKAIEKGVLQENGEIKWQRVANSDHSSIANTLTSTAVPADLDYEHYIGEAQKLLDKILQGKAPKPILHSKLITQAKRAQNKGLVIVPKGRPASEKANLPNTYSDEVIEYWKTTPLEAADWRGYRGFGAYTGPSFGIVGIDIDNPAQALKTDLFDHLGQGGIVCWHGDFGPDEVRMGKRRGTVVFRYNGDELKTTHAKYFLENGFEILYGKKVVQLAGLHPKGDAYQYRGSLKRIPNKLLNYLAWTLPDDKEPQSGDVVDQDDDTIDEMLQQFQHTASVDPEYARSGGQLDVESTQWGPQLVGLCVGHQEHTNRQGNQNMRVYVREGDIRTHCFHQSCWTVRKQWEARIKEEVCVQKQVVINPENLIIRTEAQEIAAALESPSQYKLIVAATGSGKTYTVVTHVARYLDAQSGNKDKFAIICSSKDQMIQVAKRFASILESDNINHQGIDLIESTCAIRIGGAKSREAVRDSTRVAITHYTYVSRRKFSQYYYAFLKFIDADTQVFIDEVDAFIESQTNHYPLGSRKRRITKGGKIKNIHVTKCGMFHGYNNCTNCLMNKYEGNRMNVDDYRNLGYIPVKEVMEGTRLEPLEHIDIDPRTLATVRVGTSEVSMLEQKNDPGPISFNDEGVAADFKTIFEDHLDSAYLPTVHRPIILYENEEITKDALIERFRLDQDTRLSDISDQERAKLRFPSRACNVLTVTMIDRRPLLWMAQAKSVNTLTATITPFQERFLAELFGELERCKIAPPEDRKMDQILVIGMQREIPLKMYIDGHLVVTKMFRFRETKREAEKDFEVLRNSDVPIRLGYDKRKFMLSSDENEYGHHKILLTYAFSTLGRGIDYAEYDLVDINANIYKPISAYGTDDPETLRDIMQEDRANIITQNIGRILRRAESGDKAIKIVVIERLEEKSELEATVKRLGEMSHEPVQSWWVPNFLSNEEVCEHISRIDREKALPDDLPRSYKVLIDRAQKMIKEDGAGKTEIKKAFRWATLRKKLLPEQVQEIEQSIDQMLEDRRQDTAFQPTEKDIKRRERRLKKINALQSQGKTIGQIRSRMGVYSGKNPWVRREQQWFEAAINHTP